MAKKKRNGGNPGSPVRSLSADLVRRVESIREQVAKILRDSGNNDPLPDWEAGQLSELHQALPAENRDALASLLNAIAGLGSKLKDAIEAQRKLNEAFEGKAEKADAREIDLTERETALIEREDELAPKAAKLAELERDLDQREEDARNGFAKQNAALLEDITTEIDDLKSKRDRLAADVAECERKLREGEAAKTAEIEAAETALAIRERRVDVSWRRLKTEIEEQQKDRERIASEARHAVAAELDNLRDAKERASESAKRAFEKLGNAEKELDELENFRTALGNRKPDAFLREVDELRHRVRELEQVGDSMDHDFLRSENQGLKGQRDALKAQLEDTRRDLTDKSAQLHRLHLGVSDRESLEREKRALEKHVQVLTMRLNKLAEEVDELGDRQLAPKPFPQLGAMDASIDSVPKLRSAPDLERFARDLRHRIARSEPGVELYYRERDIRLLLAGLAMSQLHILQGVSGTGKTSLVKAFAKAVGGNCTDIAVQAGWRDRDDLLGHFNAFEKRFYEKDCLQGLYNAQTPAHEDRINVILLDEMNLSRPEQYFAEFLSAIEKNDPSERVITLSEREMPGAPKLLVEGRKIKVPGNVWFFGTANHDETTNEFADKTYDRAHVQELPLVGEDDRFKPDELQDTVFSYSSLREHFDSAKDKHKKTVNELLEEIFSGPLTGVLRDRLGVEWGNRFTRQARSFVPVYIAAGGEPEEAMDHLLASRVLRRGKVTGRYDATQEDLKAVEDALLETFRSISGADPEACISVIEADRRTKGRGA